MLAWAINIHLVSASSSFLLSSHFPCRHSCPSCLLLWFFLTIHIPSASPSAINFHSNRKCGWSSFSPSSSVDVCTSLFAAVEVGSRATHFQQRKFPKRKGSGERKSPPVALCVHPTGKHFGASQRPVASLPSFIPSTFLILKYRVSFSSIIPISKSQSPLPQTNQLNFRVVRYFCSITTHLTIHLKLLNEISTIKR